MDADQKTAKVILHHRLHIRWPSAGGIVAADHRRYLAVHDIDQARHDLADLIVRNEAALLDLETLGFDLKAQDVAIFRNTQSAHAGCRNGDSGKLRYPALVSIALMDLRPVVLDQPVQHIPHDEFVGTTLRAPLLDRKVRMVVNETLQVAPGQSSDPLQAGDADDVGLASGFAARLEYLDALARIELNPRHKSLFQI